MTTGDPSSPVVGATLVITDFADLATQTDRDGRYTFPDLPGARSYAFEASAPAVASQTHEVALAAGQSAVLDFHLTGDDIEPDVPPGCLGATVDSRFASRQRGLPWGDIVIALCVIVALLRSRNRVARIRVCRFIEKESQHVD